MVGLKLPPLVSRRWTVWTTKLATRGCVRTLASLPTLATKLRNALPRRIGPFVLVLEATRGTPRLNASKPNPVRLRCVSFRKARFPGLSSPSQLYIANYNVFLQVNLIYNILTKILTGEIVGSEN